MFQNGLSFALSIVAIVVAGGILLYGLRRRGRMLSDLQILENALDQANNSLDDITSPEDMFARFDDINSDLTSTRVLRTYWAAFQRSLIRSEDRHAVGSPRGASDTFNYDLLYSPELHLRRHEAIPNQLVGIGLLGTFIGLMLSLWIASSGLEGNVDSAKQSLIALMSASAVKFATSIAAIFAALLFTHSKNAKLAGIHAKIDQFAARIDTLVIPFSRERIAEESHQQLVAQTRHMEARNDELAKSIASEINSTLQISLNEAIAPVAAEINAMAGKMGEISENTMRYMVDMFAKELGSAAKDHSERMAALLNEVSRAVEKVPEKIELSSGAFTAAMNSSVELIERTFGAASTNLTSALQETSTKMATSAAGWTTISDKLVELTRRLSETQDTFGHRLDAVQNATTETIDHLNAITREMERATANLPSMDLVALKLDAAAKALELSVNEISKIESISTDSRERAISAASDFQTTIATIERQMTALDASMASVFTRTAEGLEAFKQQTDGMAEKVDRHMGHAVKLLAETVGQLSKTLDHGREFSEAAQ